MEKIVAFLDETKNQGLDPALFAGIIDYCRKNLFAHHTGIRILSLAPGQAVAELEVASFHSNLAGFLHGGATATIADISMGIACCTTGALSVTANMNISYLAAGELGHKIAASGKVLQAGRTAVFAETCLTNQNGKVIAIATGTFLRKGFVIGDSN